MGLCHCKKPTCVICYGTAEKILWPCGHFCLCNVCSIELSNQQRITHQEYINISNHVQIKCPICRLFSIASKIYM